MLPQQSTAAAASRLPMQRPDSTDRPMAEIPIILRHAPVSTSAALRSASTPNRDTVITPLRHRLRQKFRHPRPAVTTRNMLPQQSTAAEGSRLPVQRPDSTDRTMAEIPMFLRHAPVSTSNALRSASTPNRDTVSTPLRHCLRQLFRHPRPAVTTRNMLPQQSPAAAGSRLPVQRPDSTDRPMA